MKNLLKKLFIIVLLALILCLPCKNGVANASTNNLTITKFEVESKVYDGTPVSNITVEFKDGDEVKNIDPSDYQITFKSVGTIYNSAPYVPGKYTADIKPVNPDYDFFETCQFEIYRAPQFTITINDVAINEDMVVKSPTLFITGNCYDNLNEQYCLLIDNQKVSFTSLKGHTLPVGIYPIMLEHAYLPYYDDIIINNGTYYVNRKQLSVADNTITVKKSNGINADYTLIKTNNLKYADYFDKTYSVIESFDLFFENNGSNYNVKNCTVTADIKVNNTDSLVVFVTNGNDYKQVKSVVNDNSIIFEVNDDYTGIVFVNKKQKVTLYVFSVILIILSISQIIITFKVFKLKSYKVASICAPEFLLIYFNSIDIFIFILSIWIFVLSTIIMVYSYILYKHKKQVKKINIADNDDMELYNYLKFKKQDNKEYELEEIIEDNTKEQNG